MIKPREPDDPRLSQISLRKEFIADGIHDRAIAALVASGSLHRVRHGAYVDGAAWRACDEVGQHALVVRAVLRQAHAEVVVSHISALCEWDVPMWDTSLETVDVTREDQKSGRTAAGVRQHLGALREKDVVRLNGIRVTAPTRSSLDSLSLLDVEHGVTTLSDLLHRGLTTEPELDECATYMKQWPNTLNHGLVLRLANGRCESVGESRTWHLCWRQHLPMPQAQYSIEDRWGREFARVDFAWPELKVFLEFDGKFKYEKYLKPGESAIDAVLREKKREELICELTGWRCIRITWADLYQPERVAARIRAMFSPVSATAG
jgi:hypothetical protein